MYGLPGCNEGERSVGIWPCFLGSRAPKESEKPLEQQEEEGENVLSWKQEEEGVPRERK